MRLRDYTPRGYNARHILILIVPMIVFVLSMTLFFFNNHVQEVNTKLSRSVAREIAFLVDRHHNSPDDWPGLVSDLSRVGLMDTTFVPGVTTLTPPDGRTCCKQFDDELRQVLTLPYASRFQPGDRMTVRVLTPEGLMEVRFDRKRVVIITAHIFIVWSVGFSVLLLAMSYAFLRNQVRSILQLASAADAFGRGEDLPDFKPSGAKEVRQAARTVIRMRNRIRRYADQRTAMLAGVSHDLRTPLTRLKLELALAPKDYDTAAAKADISEMERMLDGYLAFARGEEGEQPEEADLSAITADATSHIGTRAQLTVNTPGPVLMRLRPLALKRAISNLANNAADHGKTVRVSIVREVGSATVVVEDDGPGIPAELHEDAFRPFSRLDASRNQNVSGVGLGLTIARDTARAHGGDLTLGTSDLGGLRAVIRLPFDVERRKDPRD
jgi:two-component system, OmpR family, osmolarity sensor histidine kinase EnvZ